MLFKNLGGPPEYVVFILATTEVHKIPNTILSRCMQFDFRLIPVNELTEIVTNIFDKENYKYEIEACRQIAIHGEGSARYIIYSRYVHGLFSTKPYIR